MSSSFLGEYEMLRTGLLIAGLAIGLSGPAMAANCPNDMAAIDKAMQTAQLSDADKAKVQELRKQGEDQHNAGQHDESVKTLGEAKKMMGMQ